MGVVMTPHCSFISLSNIFSTSSKYQCPNPSIISSIPLVLWQPPHRRIHLLSFNHKSNWSQPCSCTVNNYISSRAVRMPFSQQSISETTILHLKEGVDLGDVADSSGSLAVQVFVQLTGSVKSQRGYIRQFWVLVELHRNPPRVD